MPPASSVIDFENLASWNIEGLTESKLMEVQCTMHDRGIGVMCIQETHRANSYHFITEMGFLVILSGTSQGVTKSAGVGFLIAPECRHAVVSFKQASSRMAALKLRARGGKIGLISAYAPHSGYPFPDRQQFYSQLVDFVRNVGTHGAKLICGDFNARLTRRLPGEE